MTVSSGFFNSVNHDRLYDAEQLSSIFDGIIIDGVYENYGDAFHVMEYTEANNTIIIGTGRAWFDHTWTLNDSQFSMTIDPPNEMLGRTDAIVIDVDHRQSERVNSILYVKGSESNPDTPPVLINETLHKQHPIAYIKRNAGSDQVVHQKDITDLVGTESCPVVTSVLEAQNLANLWDQLDDEFNTWWDGIKDVLDENTVTNLQNQINELKDKDEARGDGVGLLTKEVYDLFKTGSYPFTIKSFSANISDVRAGSNAHYGGVFILPDGKIASIYTTQSTTSSHINGYKMVIDIYTTDGVKTTSTSELLGNYSAFGGMGFDVIYYYMDNYPCTLVLGNAYRDTSGSGVNADKERLVITTVTITLSSDGVVTFSAPSSRSTNYYDEYLLIFSNEFPLSDGSFIYGAVHGGPYYDEDPVEANLGGFAAKISSTGVIGNFVSGNNYVSGGYPLGYNNYGFRIAVFEDEGVGRFKSHTSDNRYNEIDLEDLTVTTKTGTFSYPTSNYNMSTLPSNVETDIFSLSESGGFISQHRNIGATSDTSVKKSDYYVGGNNSAISIPEGAYYATTYGESSYIGSMSNGVQVAIGSNGGAAILNAKKSSVSISNDPIATWRNGYKVVNGKTIIVRILVSQTYSQYPQMLNPALQNINVNGNITVIGG